MDSPDKLCDRHWDMWFCADEEDPEVALQRILKGEKLKSYRGQEKSP